MITQSKMPTVLAAGDKIKYKKSLAKMMVYWIINTRSEWLERLLTGQDDYWKTDLPHLAGAFTSDQERNDFLARVRQTVGGEVMKLALNTMNMHSMKEWVQMDIDPFCPADEAIDLMYKAFADCVNSLPEQ